MELTLTVSKTVFNRDAFLVLLNFAPKNLHFVKQDLRFVRNLGRNKKILFVYYRLVLLQQSLQFLHFCNFCILLENLNLARNLLFQLSILHLKHFQTAWCFYLASQLTWFRTKLNCFLHADEWRLFEKLRRWSCLALVHHNSQFHLTVKLLFLITAQLVWTPQTAIQFFRNWFAIIFVMCLNWRAVY